MHPVHKIQKWLSNNNFHAFIVPRCDRFQGEYTHPCDDRLNWLTNFSGSAGLSIIGRNTASIFVDGRYTIQAKSEVDLTILSLESYDNHTIRCWFLQKLKAGDQVAFDPWLTSITQLDQWKSMCVEGVDFIPIPHNPIDSLWDDQPAAPVFLIQPYPIKYSGRSARSKIDEVVDSLKNKGIDACIISQSDSISWLLNIRAQIVPYTPVVHGFLILKASGEILLFTNAQDPRSELFDGIEVQLYPEDQLLSFVRQLKGNILIDPAGTPVAIDEAVKSGHVRKINMKDPAVILRARKNLVEQEGMRRCHLRDGLAVIQFLSWLDDQIESGALITEMEADDKLLQLREQQDLFMDQSFPTIAASGAHGAIVHYRSKPETNATIAPPTIFLLDSGAQYLDGTTDITRTVAFGEPTLIQKQMFTRVLKGHIALAMAVFPKGTCGEQLDVLARQYLWEIGCDYAHGTGHGVGTYLSVHEGPQLITRIGTRVPLEPGMVVSNEPGYYEEGQYGIRIENLVMVVEHKHLPGMLCFENLTQVPIDRKLIDVSLLTDLELRWINHYHQNIRQLFSEKIDNEETNLWLIRNTKLLV